MWLYDCAGPGLGITLLKFSVLINGSVNSHACIFSGCYTSGWVGLRVDVRPRSLKWVWSFFFLNYFSLIILEWHNNIKRSWRKGEKKKAIYLSLSRNYYILKQLQLWFSPCTFLFKIIVITAINNNQQEATVSRMELCSTLCASLEGRGVGGRMDVCVCVCVCVWERERDCVPSLFSWNYQCCQSAICPYKIKSFKFQRK